MERRIGDIAIIGISAIVLIGMLGYATPQIIFPIDNFETTNNSVLFVFDKADAIFIDDNLEFSSPTEIRAEDNLVVNMKPGVYYWKLKGALESKVHTLTIVSEVDLKLRESGEKYELVNAGNIKLNVDIYNGTTLRGKTILDVGESKNASGTLFVGGESDE